MFNSRLLCAAALGGALLLGCDDQKNKNASPAAPGGTTPTTKPSGEAGRAPTTPGSGAPGAGGSATDPGTGAEAGTEKDAKAAADAGAEAGGDAAGGPAAGANKADDMLKRAMTLATKGQVDMAEEQLDKVEAMGDELTSRQKEQARQARDMLKAAKAKEAAGSQKVPDLKVPGEEEGNK